MLRAVGMPCSASAENVAPVVVCLVSTTGDAALTVTDSCTVDRSSLALICAEKPD